MDGVFRPMTSWDTLPLTSS